MIDNKRDLVLRIKQSRSSQKIRIPVKDYYARYLLTRINQRYDSFHNWDLSHIDNSYNVVVADSTIDNPFQISSELVSIIQSYVSDCKTDDQKARKIYDWFEENVDYGISKKELGYSNSLEVLKNQEGVCGEMAFLYVSMARCLSLRASYASISIDYQGKEVHHACAAVHLNSTVLVDPAYHSFDIQHKEYEILTDFQVLSRYLQWRSKPK